VTACCNGHPDGVNRSSQRAAATAGAIGRPESVLVLTGLDTILPSAAGDSGRHHLAVDVRRGLGRQLGMQRTKSAI
jgi:hypothetical protein